VPAANEPQADQSTRSALGSAMPATRYTSIFVDGARLQWAPVRYDDEERIFRANGQRAAS
jgi:hypothetical protein